MNTNWQEKRARPSTINQQNYINKIAKDVMTEHPGAAKYALAETVSTELKDIHQITLKASAIEREYLSNYHNY